MVVNIVEAFDEYRAERVAGFLEEAIQHGARVLDCSCGKMRVGELMGQELDIEVIGVDVISLNDTDLDRHWEMQASCPSRTTVLMRFTRSQCYTTRRNLKGC